MEIVLLFMGVNSAGLDIDSANVAYSEDGETADIILE